MPEEYTNIDCFNIAAACILGDLYNAFPRPLDIRTPDYQDNVVKNNFLPTTCALNYTDEQGGGNTISGTLRYLEDEGLIRSAAKTRQFDENEVLFQNLVLTAKGFSALSSPAQDEPTSSETLGKKFSDIKAHATKAVISSAVGALFKTIAS